MPPACEVQDEQLYDALSDGGAGSALANLNATVCHGSVRPGHGIFVRLAASVNSGRGAASRPTNGRVQVEIDVHGGVFAALPGGVGSMAQMLLPLRATVDDVEAQATHNGEWSGCLTLGAKKLSRGRLESTLRGIIDAGDPAFVLELRSVEREGGLLGFLPTRASLLLRGLAQPSRLFVRDTVVPGHIFRKSRVRLCLGWLRWWLAPLAFLVASWWLFLQPQEFLPLIPLLSMLDASDGGDGGQASVVSVLPPHPRSMAEAFQLGQIHAELQRQLAPRALGEPASPRVESLLEQASNVLGESDSIKISPEQMDAMLPELRRLETNVGVIARVLGFFTFVNTMWMFAILGVSLSVGPTLFHVLKPLHRRLRRLLRWLYNQLLLPSVLRLHRWGVLEVMIWASCWIGLVQGMKMTSATDIGEMVSLTASGLMVPALGYTAVLRGKRAPKDVLATIFPLFFAAACVPWALHYQSTLYGYLVVISVYSALGFGVAHSQLCLCIGFDSKESCARCCASSLALILSFLALRTSGVFDQQAGARDILSPFSSAISVFGTIVLFLSLLIISSRRYLRSSKWGYSNLLMVFLLIACNIIGQTTGLTGMANTATTFTVLWLLEKYAEFHLEAKWNGWALVFLLSVASWRASLWLHAHPAHIVSMFS